MGDYQNPYDTTSLAQGISKGIDENVRTYQNGKIADSIVRTNPEMLDALQMTKEQFGSMSATDRASTVTGAITAIGMKQQAAEARARQMEETARAQYFQGAANWRNSQADTKEDPQAAEARYQLMLQQALGGGQGGPPAGAPGGPALDIGGNNGMPGPAGMMTQAPAAPPANGGETSLSPQQLMMMMSRSGLNPQQQQQEIANLRMMGVVRDEDAVQEDPATGARYLPGKNGQPVILGYNPKTAAGNVFPVHDADGNPTGQSVAFDAKSGRIVLSKGADAAADNKANMAAQLEGEKALNELDDRIKDWQYAADKAAKDPKLTPPDKDRLKELQARRDRLYNILQNTGPQAGPAPKGAAAAPTAASGRIRVLDKAGKPYTVPASQKDDALKAGYTLAP